MSKRGPAPALVRHTYAPDPNPAKVEAALDLWRRALAQRMAEGPKTPYHRPSAPR